MKRTRFLVIHQHSNMALDEPTIATELHTHHIEFHELKDPSTDIDTIGFITTDLSVDQLDFIFQQIRDAGDLCGGEVQLYELSEPLRIELQPP